jgi:hypothetical protein
MTLSPPGKNLDFQKRRHNSNITGIENSKSNNADFQSMMHLIEPLAREICANLLQREMSLSTQNIAKIDC